jgi:peroxiredoxin
LFIDTQNAERPPLNESIPSFSKLAFTSSPNFTDTMSTHIRRRILLLLAAALPLFAAAQTGTFVLAGHLTGQKSGTVHLDYRGADGRKVHDSTRLKNGAFRFTGRLELPTPAILYTTRTRLNIADDPHATELFLEPGSITGVFAAANVKVGRVTGSRSQADLDRLTQAEDSLFKKWSLQWRAYWTAIANQDQHAQDSLRNGPIARYNRAKEHVQKQFIRNHPHSFVSPWLLGRLNLPTDTAKAILAVLDSTVAQSPPGLDLAAAIRYAERLHPGREAPVFIQPDTAGRVVSLTDFRGKYVLVDFWASWCVPCREESPFLVSAANKYRDKGFTIIGISLDDPHTRAAWLEAIRKDGLDWTQLSDGKAWENTAALLYSIPESGIPANFLVDPNGTIVAVSLHKKALEETLAKLFEGKGER